MVWARSTRARARWRAEISGRSRITLDRNSVAAAWPQPRGVPGLPIPAWVTPSEKNTMRSPGLASNRVWRRAASRPEVSGRGRISVATSIGSGPRRSTNGGLSYSRIRVAPQGSISTMVKVE